MFYSFYPPDLHVVATWNGMAWDAWRSSCCAHMVWTMYEDEECVFCMLAVGREEEGQHSEGQPEYLNARQTVLCQIHS